MARGQLTARLARLVRPDVPEPIEERDWRRAARLGVVVLPLFAVMNVLSRTMVARTPHMDLAAFDRLLVYNVGCHALGATAAGLALWRARREAHWRTATYVMLATISLTVVYGLSLTGSLTSPLWLIMAAATIAVARIYFDARLGLAAVVVMIVLHGGLIGLELAGVARAHALYPTMSAPEYASATATITMGAWALITYVLTWVLASFTAHQIRSSQHALRGLNRELEERVAAQVAQLERVGRLRRYLAPQLVERLTAADVDPVAVRERRAVTVLFADLRGFSTMVEQVPADRLVDLLNFYFDEVARIAFRHGGTIDKFIGDAIMVIFGAPYATSEADQAVRALGAAREMQQRIAELADEFQQRGAHGPLIARIGIASGVVTVGAFGAHHRMDFTVVGTPVNRAARLEPLAPPGGILVDDETRVLAGAQVRFGEASEVTLKGFARPVKAHLVA